ncbi:Uncharacterized protein APZ42_006174 [Daphnia magna]|uniref:Uncharacterized protein n=1 Tax=Daphnia magna TaxID=35525 RepID=A0A0P4Z249_9CRUS|nr:Uncharacterized protein APZ42_006174 [Daphnia magna]
MINITSDKLNGCLLRLYLFSVSKDFSSKNCEFCLVSCGTSSLPSCYQRTTRDADTLRRPTLTTMPEK